MRKILSIDGGGIKGVVPAAFLTELEKKIDGKLVDYFDLICGVSTGGIIALGLGLGLTAKRILEFYEENGSKIFPNDKWYIRLKICAPWSWVASRYTAEALETAFSDAFKEKLLGDSTCRLVIPSLYLENGEPHIFKTPHAPQFQTDRYVKAAEVARATAAAPTYFPTHRLDGHAPLIDGGLFANNPTIDAVLEALHILNWDKRDVEVLSLGCTYEPLDVRVARDKPMGEGYWAKKFPGVMFAAQSHTSLGKSRIMLGGKHKVVRVDQAMPKDRFALDSVAEIKSLKGVGYQLARNESPKLIAKFFSEKALPYTPEAELKKRPPSRGNNAPTELREPCSLS